VKILGECRYAAKARKMVPDESHTLKEFHFVDSRRPVFAAAIA